MIVLMIISNFIKICQVLTILNKVLPVGVPLILGHGVFGRTLFTCL